MLVLAASAYDWVLALHIIAVVIAFGWTFALPVIFAVGSKMDPRSLPVLHRVEVVVSRFMLNPALVVIVGAGVFMASDGHHWKEFFVQWGLVVAIVLGGLVGAVLMPASKTAEEAVRRDLEAWDGTGEFEPGDRYGAAARRLNTIGALASGLVLVTIVIMAVKP
ncbi:MAG: hypothetical protein ACYDC2_09640 [Solirubrobacteraceae bacterium]